MSLMSVSSKANVEITASQISAIDKVRTLGKLFGSLVACDLMTDSLKNTIAADMVNSVGPEDRTTGTAEAMAVAFKTNVERSSAEQTSGASGRYCSDITTQLQN
jgi:hypothetical protein